MYWEIDVQLYNIASTGLPIVVADILDKDLPAPFSIEYPDLYVATQIDSSSICTPLSLSRCCFRGSLVIVVVMSYGLNASDKAAGSKSRVKFGMIAFSLTVLIVGIKIWMIADLYKMHFSARLSHCI